MIGKILGSGQLGKLASFVSPAFFDVMPAKALWSKARKLFAGTRDREAFRHAVAARAAELAKRQPEVELATERGSLPRPAADTATPSAAWRAAQVCELFFHQLFHGGTTLLDLRAASFRASGERLYWQPASWLADWSPEFLTSLRDLYRGFYARDDATFRRGLAALSLSHSEDLFRQHFGGDQAQVTFKTVDFVDTFHKVFLRCKEAGTALHPDFLPLGIYLAALYDHLEELGVPVDVSAAYAKATSTEPRTQESVHA